MRGDMGSSGGVEIDTQMVRLGEKAVIDDGVVLGYLPVRGGHVVLIIGSQAHVRRGTIIYGGSRIGQNLETGHNVIIREENDIGDDFRIWNNSVIDYGCRIANNVKIHNNVYIAQYTIIEDDVFLAPGVSFANDLHPGCPHSHECMRGPYIKRGAQIGVNSTILPRIVIGEYAVIGAGSVVTKNIPDGTVAYGNPAEVKGDIDDITCHTGLGEKPYSHITRRV
jgi:acetyltransferase-like isoleucine patch superfamily enzyme